MGLGFVSSKSDIFSKSGVTVYVLIYVDNIFIASSTSAAADKLIKKLTEDFAIKGLGNLSYYPIIEVTTRKSRLLLSDRKYADDLLHRVNTQNCKPSLTPEIC